MPAKPLTMGPGMLAGVIFDFDGVIADSHPVHLRAWKTFLRSLGKDVRDDELAFVLEGSKREEILRHFVGNITEQQVRDFGAEKERLFQAIASELRMVRGFAEFLAQIETAGIPAAVATSGSRPRVERTLEKFALRDRFRLIVTGDDVPRGKPDPALFLLAARSLQTEVENILVCEDAVSGVVAARAAGMKCLAIAANSRAARLKEAGASIIVEDFTQTTLGMVRQLFAQQPPAATSVT
ncbi:MAG: HAD family phosphatase [Acidobacteriia bacterium]|nr:HAD family phosphatase [Terriglobia bacterium]